MTKLRCGGREENLNKFGSEECGYVPPHFMSTLCQYHDIVALKTIRIRDLQVLGEISKVGEHDVKVIHLLRDPRAVVNSRRQFPHFYLRDLEEVPVEPLTKRKIARAAHDYCDHEYRNLLVVDSMPEWLHGNYLQISHAQISTNPVKTLEKMYSFLKIDIPDNVRDWAASLARTAESEEGYLTTRKNSTEVMGKWRLQLESHLVNTIEKICSDLMGRLALLFDVSY